MAYYGFASFKTYTDDGEAWSYGYGEYNKRLSDAGVSLVPSSLATVLGVSAVNQLASSILVPTFYIWARDDDASNTKFIAEWPYARSVRDARFNAFAVETQTKKSYANLFSVILKYQQQAPAFTPANLAAYAGIEKTQQGSAALQPTSNTTDPKSLPGNDATTGAYGVLIVAGALAVAYFLFRR